MSRDLNPGADRVETLLAECAQIPLDPRDEELGALALALHIEEATGATLPPDALTAEALVPRDARERTVRDLIGSA